MNVTEEDTTRGSKQVANEQSPSLLTIILDTNPAAWALLSSHLSLSQATADLVVFINAHLACNYTNKVAVIASHCDKAQWLYPTPLLQELPDSTRQNGDARDEGTKLRKGKGRPAEDQGSDVEMRDVSGPGGRPESNKYRPFRLVEEEVVGNLQKLLISTSPSEISTRSSTKIAGALTLALSYINRETTAHNEATTGSAPGAADPTSVAAASSDSAAHTSLANPLHSRIMMITLSPSTDLAHQYIPIMNSIFACQRLGIPIDVLQLPLPTKTQTSSTAAAPSTSGPNNTVFLQQAADATHGIFIPAHLSTMAKSNEPPAPGQPVTSLASSAILTYLLTAFLPNPMTRMHMILPTRIDVDFRAACFCHRNVISIGFVCSICLSIFCSVPEAGECLTCGTKLSLGDYGRAPIVVPRKKKKKKNLNGSAAGTPRPGTPAAA